MVKKLAFFVEGQTEQIFLKSLLEQMAGQKRIDVHATTYQSTSLTKLELTKKRIFRSDLKYFVLLTNCENDEKVKSVILDQRPTLTSAGYSLILGLRDLYPKTVADIANVKTNIAYGLPTVGVPTRIFLAVAEVEAWFVQDHTHYAKIDPALVHSNFKANFGFDPMLDSAESVPWPSDLLHRIYQTAGKAYKKSKRHVDRTVGVLDYGEMYMSYPGKLPHLRALVDQIDAFLS